jgi:hypothetical protein
MRSQRVPALTLDRSETKLDGLVARFATEPHPTPIVEFESIAALGRHDTVRPLQGKPVCVISDGKRSSRLRWDMARNWQLTSVRAMALVFGWLFAAGCSSDGGAPQQQGGDDRVDASIPGRPAKVGQSVAYSADAARRSKWLRTLLGASDHSQQPSYAQQEILFRLPSQRGPRRCWRGFWLNLIAVDQGFR